MFIYFYNILIIKLNKIVDNNKITLNNNNNNNNVDAFSSSSDSLADVSSLEDDIKTKEEFKYSSELEEGAKAWIRELLKNDELFTSNSLAQELKSGRILCE